MNAKTKRIITIASAVVPIAIFGLAAWVLFRLAHRIHLEDVLWSLEAVPTYRIGLTFAAMIVSYLVITSYDAVIVRFLGLRMSYARTAKTAYVAASISSSLGFNMFTSGPIRLRLYMGYGLSVIDVGKIVFFGMVMYWSGFFCVGGTMFTFWPIDVPPPVSISDEAIRIIGIVLLCIIVTYASLCILRVRICIKGLCITPPSVRLMTLQLVVASLDWLLASTVLFMILPSHPGPSFFRVVEAYLVAQSLGLLSHVPGGLGVFDTIILLLVGPAVGDANVAASLLIYRIINYVCPFAGGIITFASTEILHKIRHPS